MKTNPPVFRPGRFPPPLCQLGLGIGRDLKNLGAILDARLELLEHADLDVEDIVVV